MYAAERPRQYTWERRSPGFQIFGVDFHRHQGILEGWTNPSFNGAEDEEPHTYNVNTITNYAALKHLAPSGKRYVADNDTNTPPRPNNNRIKKAA